MKRYRPWLDDLYHLNHLIFWAWNLLCLLVVFAGILPHVGVPLARAIAAGEVETVFLLPLAGLAIVPPACAGLGWCYFRRRPRDLMRLFYGIEAPLVLLCLVRLFLLRDLTPASSLVIGTVLVAIAAFSLDLFAGDRGCRRPWLGYLQAGLSVALVLVGVWAGLLLLIYAVPVAKLALDQLANRLWWADVWLELRHLPPSSLPTLVIFTVFFVLSVALFLSLPSALVALYLHAGQRLWRAVAGDRERRLQIGLGTATAWLVLFLATNQQPQVAALARLATADNNLQARRALLAEAPSLRRGLTNAYLASYRYLGSREEGESIAQLYRHTFEHDGLAEAMQIVHDGLLSPFLYQGAFDDAATAAARYADFFDQPIQKGERDAIRRALQSTAILDDAEAGTLNIDQRKVLLARQEVTVTEQGNWAEVELHEVYRNQTPDEEEIFYSFSLPETAAITGVWLGDTGDRERRFPFQVSPRGAAQQVYKSQVNRVRPVDPALLEQVGPHHYRLRAFPIPPRQRSWETEPLERPTEMHLWLTYRVMQHEGRWPLPQLSERRNIFWTAQTQRFRNGAAVESGDRWLDASLPATKATPTRQVATLAGYRVSAQPLTDTPARLPGDQRFAVVLDTSYSMRKQQAAVQESLDWLEAQGFADGDLANNEADLYVAQAEGLPPQRFENLANFNRAQQPAYGSLQLTDLLGQFEQLRGDRAYAAILLLTDAGSYELADDGAALPELPAPVWVVHLGGEFPAGYQDKVLDVLQAPGSGVASSLPEVVQRLAATAAQPAQLASTEVQLANLADGYAWTFAPITGDNASIEQSEAGFVPLAARQLVRGLSWQNADGELAQLDAMHAIAQQTAIVTPYSSMVVLVNDEQRRALAEAAAAADRFDREVEHGQEQLTQPFSPLQTGGAASVPEPSLVVGFGAIALVLLVKRRR